MTSQIVAKIAPHTEADPAAILTQLLVCAGALIGRDAYFQVEATRHHPNEFLVLVGDSAKALGNKAPPLARMYAGPGSPTQNSAIMPDERQQPKPKGDPCLEEFLTVDDIARILKLNPTTVRNWISSGYLQGQRIGRRVRIQRDAFERFIDANYTGTMPTPPATIWDGVVHAPIVPDSAAADDRR